MQPTTLTLDWCENAPRADVQARRIGHFGFFREQFSRNLWPRLADSLHRLATLTSSTTASVSQTTA